jgi:PAS domain S-box-containing protein
MGTEIGEGQTTDTAKLRQRTEKEPKAKIARVPPFLADAESQRLLHELEVSQDKLEMLNDELLKTRDELAIALGKCNDLYDFAPVGYLTLDRDRVIHGVNITGASFLGVKHSQLLNHSFDDFVVAETRPAFTAFIEKVFTSKVKEAFEVNLLVKGDSSCFVQIEALAATSGQECRIALIDITERKRNEDEIRKDKALFRCLIDSVGDLIFIKDMHGAYQACNKAGEAFIGLPECEQIGKTDFDFFDRNMAEGICEYDRQIMDSGKERRFEEWITCQDGRRRLFDTVKAPFYGPDGKKLGLVGIARDITARKQAEEELRESEGQYSSLFNNQHVVMLLIDPETGEILNTNPAACSFYGYNREQFSSLKIFDINNLPKRDIMRIMKQALNKETSLFQFRHRLANGEIRDVEEYSGPIEIKERRLLYTIVHDVSERREMEENLLKSERQLAEAQRLAHIGSWEWDSLTNKLTASDEINRIFGLSISSYDRFLELVHTDDRETIKCAVSETIACQSPYDVHYRIILPNGTNRIIHAQGASIADGDGKTLRIIGTVQDVTDRREMEERLEMLNTELTAHAVELAAANRDLEAFNAAVSHDLSEPLTKINSICQILLNYHADQLDKTGNEYLRGIFSSTLQMSHLINTFLNFSRSSHCAIVRQTVGLSGMATQIAADLEKASPERKRAFKIAERITARGDPDLLQVVMVNILGNAWKFTARKEDAVIEFGIMEYGGMPAYFVRDNGVGFDMGQLDRLFVPFHRLPNQDGFTGHGLGLATVQRIISSHGGRIWAEGEPGKGATFYFTL